ncbi:Dimethyl-sulfide monooxygenase [Variovorax sp. PBL-H6]|uniref:NtaA/DmoA family FMN-dependent monooxygenase n=1 Tax=Variovorax sp. PBL-H6 TaxID=434009 RepID=UPI001317B187|nr:NtaA/DmoA family FMN-dependent monooxygenase [Variovorax sp. PBL-H6]VTU33378.1 Dimethyl-sulfide monooxygenase [Variovorax sp. PBL-H6]
MPQLLANAFYCGSPGQSWAGLWSHPDSKATEYNTLGFWTELAQTCERGLLDGIFLADGLGVSDVYEGKPDAMLRAGSFVPLLDPMLLLPCMAQATRNLSFGVTGNTSYETPYLLARRLSTLDHLTQGRVAWNVVSGVLEATARGVGVQNQVAHDERYAVADEFVELMYKLWEGSWEDGAAVRDKATRTFVDPARVHAIHHAGKYFRCDAVHMSEPSMQRTPLMFSAGASAAGLDFVGKHAECAFIAYGSPDFARKQVRQIREKAVAYGRAQDDVKVFVPATIIVAPTDAQARELQREYENHTDGAGNLATRSQLIGIDLAKYSLDDPVPSVQKTNASQAAAAALTTGAQKPLRIRDLMGFGEGRDLFLVGSPSTVADKLVAWAEDTGVDGLNLIRTVEPKGLQAFCDLLVPELQNRGAFKEQYAPGSLREKLFPGTGGRVKSTHPATRYGRGNAR